MNASYQPPYLFRNSRHLSFGSCLGLGYSSIRSHHFISGGLPFRIEFGVTRGQFRDTQCYPSNGQMASQANQKLKIG